MNQISLEQARNAISNYLNGFDNCPYFVLVEDDATYREIISFIDGDCVRTSDFCNQDDSFPDIDGLIMGLNARPKDSKTVLLGLGEWLHLHANPLSDNASNNFTIRKLGVLKDKYFPGKVVVLCRFLYTDIHDITCTDAKFTAKRHCFIPQTSENSACKVIQTDIDLNCSTINGFKNLLKELEKSDKDFKTLYVRSSLSLNGVKRVSSAFEALQLEDSHFTGERSWLTDQLWEEYRADKYLPNDNTAPHWRTFLRLKLNGASEPCKEYKEYVANVSSTYAEYKKKVFSALLDFSPSDSDFQSMYKQRKRWIKGIEEAALSAFISGDLITKCDQFQIYYLTDNTSVERQAILKWLSKNELTDEVRNALKWIYPDLYWYLRPYHFTNVTNAANVISNDEFDDYFEQYRFQKVVNHLSEDFLERVNQYSLTRPYNSLQTRGSVLEQFQQEQDKTFLYWLDALGVEYLPYIQNWAKENELNMVTHVVQSILPTITSENKEFYDRWENGKKNAEPNKELDTIKHKGVPGLEEAQYLEKELEVIKSVLEEIHNILEQQTAQFDKVVLVSDHGASRLAVLGGQEVGCEMREKGIHSGRCCPVNELDDNPPDCVTQEEDYWVFANYQRFKGGRKADVEVHGGATLEEVVVPVIEFSLKTPKKVKVKDPGIAKVEKNQCAELKLACSKPLENAWVKWNDKSYPIQHCDGVDYSVTFTGVTVKSGEYTAEVWENDSYLNDITFTLEKGFGKASGISDMFD